MKEREKGRGKGARRGKRERGKGRNIKRNDSSDRNRQDVQH